jgi:hypothetical protein
MSISRFVPRANGIGFPTRTSIAMCHGYEMRWWKSETTAKEKTKEADVIRKPTARQDEKVKSVSKDKVDEKELVPAE